MQTFNQACAMCQALRGPGTETHQRERAVWEMQGDNSEACTGHEEKTEEEQPHDCNGRKAWGWELERCGGGQETERGGGGGPFAQEHPAQQRLEHTSSARDSEWAGGSNDRRLEHTGGQARSWTALNGTPGSPICNLV